MPTYYDLTVSLRDVLPRPWRRVLLRRTATFAALHDAIQTACGWADSHLYHFHLVDPPAQDVPIAGRRIGDGHDDDFGPVPDAARVRLARYLGPGLATTALYTYDFGDDWRHDVQLNDVVDRPEKFTRRLVGGEHAFPPDDCGGAGGYAELQAALRTGRDPEGLVAWARGVWGWTGAFDLGATRARFAR